MSRLPRREFLRGLRVCAAALLLLSTMPRLGWADVHNAAAGAPPAGRRQRPIGAFSPNARVPGYFWPDAPGTIEKFKSILEALEPFRDKTLVLRGVSNKVRGDGDGHMRGMSCLLTGIELFPGNIQGGSDTPAGWSRGISIDQELKNFLQQNPVTRTRYGSLEFGVAVPDRADPWTRMSYAGANQPVSPEQDPYQMFDKLYGRSRDKETLKSVFGPLEAELQQAAARVSTPEDRRLLEEHLTLLRQAGDELQRADGGA